MIDEADRYWQQFRASLPAGAPCPERYVEAFIFGTRPEGARNVSAGSDRGTYDGMR